MINDLWYKNAIVYCLSVATYMDSDGDGIGDFKGLMRRLDYLQGLGVTAIWLMPFQPSPGRDGGYDVTDYYGVDPKYGSLGDFVEFAHGCKQRGMHVLGGHLKSGQLGSLQNRPVADHHPGQYFFFYLAGCCSGKSNLIQPAILDQT
jgi:Alpha amylase, catalytic domain